MPRARRSLVEKPRLLKFVGDPQLVGEDGFSVPNWRYENNRLIDLPGKVTRIIKKDDGAELDAQGKPIPGTGVSREYVWHKTNRSRIIEVSFRDAAIILRVSGNEFKDVTDLAHPEKVRSDRIVVKKKQRANARA